MKADRAWVLVDLAWGGVWFPRGLEPGCGKSWRVVAEARGGVGRAEVEVADGVDAQAL